VAQRLERDFHPTRADLWSQVSEVWKLSSLRSSPLAV
jgi:hypothetical protein